MTRSLGGCLVFWLVGLSAPATAGEWPQIVLSERWAGFTRPVQLVHAGDGSGRLFVVEQGGSIVIIRDGEVEQTPFLDISDRVACCGEQGLLGVAFPPGYSVKGAFYVNYTDRAGDTVVARYRLTGDPDRADPSSEQVILAIDQPFANHNGGQLEFGPDGYLYIGTGDGGSSGDPRNNAQNRLSLLGKILRIDVESGAEPYAVPASNPFADLDDAQPEIWALGLRNPWRFSFDRVTGDLYIADVGQNSWEEVHVQPASSGGGENYGWRVLEGSHCYGQAQCDRDGLELPAVEYDHSVGCSITGGHVSRSFRWPELEGVYLYGDFCSGRIWGLRRSGDGWQSAELADTSVSISAFGVDEVGTLYVLDHDSGRVFEITGEGEPSTRRLLVPGVAHVTGSGGTPWRADLAAVNPSGRSAELELTFRSQGLEIDRTAVLGPGAAAEWRDVLVSLFGLAETDSRSGVVEVVSEVAVAVTARSYAVTDHGTVGQFLPALSAADGIGPGQRGRLPQLVRSSERYSNVGVVNLGQWSCRVAITVHAGDGAALGDPLLFELEPGEWRQAFDVLAPVGDHEIASAVIDVLTPDCTAWGYASVVDRPSRDPTTIPMQRLP